MYIRELTGFKSNPHYQQATDAKRQAKQEFGGDLSDYNNRINSLIKFQKYLVSNGFKPLGGPGQGGTAFEHPNYPWVFKIFTHDPAYLDYVQYAKQHQDNPRIPKFKGNIIKINDKTFVVRIEKLYNIPRGIDSNLLFSIIGRIYELPDIEELKEKYPDQYEYVTTTFPGIFDIIIDLATKYPKNAMDLHRGNIMQRPDGTIVISDPMT